MIAHLELPHIQTCVSIPPAITCAQSGRSDTSLFVCPLFLSLSRKGARAMSIHEKTSQRTTKAAKVGRSVSDNPAVSTDDNRLPTAYSKAHQLLQDREYEKARGAYARLAIPTAMADFARSFKKTWPRSPPWKRSAMRPTKAHARRSRVMPKPTRNQLAHSQPPRNRRQNPDRRPRQNNLSRRGIRNSK